MIKELVNFTENIDDDFKTLGSLPKEGLHIMLQLKKEENRATSIDPENLQFEQYAKKQKEEVSDFLNTCKLLHQNAWCINTNKCFDLPTKAIHTCSPFAVAFKKEHLEGGGKYNDNQAKKKKQIYERFGDYFNKAFALLDDTEKEKYVLFENFFTQNEFSKLIDKIEKENAEKYKQLGEQNDQLLIRALNMTYKFSTLHT